MAFPGSVASDTDGLTQATHIQTTDATQTTLYSRTLPAVQTIRFRIEITGTKSDGTDRASYVREGVVYCSTTATATLGGSIYAPVPDYASDGTWGGVAISVSGAQLLAKVTGKSSTTINWRSRVTLAPA